MNPASASFSSVMVRPRFLLLPIGLAWYSAIASLAEVPDFFVSPP